VIDDKVVFLELKEKGRIAQKLPTAKRTTSDGKPIVLVDFHGPEGGFKEWKEKHWLPQLYAEANAAAAAKGKAVGGYTQLTAAEQGTSAAGPPAKGSPSAKGSPIKKTPGVKSVRKPGALGSYRA